MKEKLKYIAAVVLAGSITGWFLPFAQIGDLKLSLMRILKTCLGFYSGSETEGFIYAAVRTYLAPYMWWIVGGVVLILVEAFLAAVLRGRASYIIAMTGSIVNSILLAVTGFLLYGQLREVEHAVGVLDEEMSLSLEFLSILVLGICYLVVFLVSLIGLLLWARSEEEEPEEDIYLEEMEHLRRETVPMSYEEYKGMGYDTEEMDIPGQTEKSLAEERFEEEQEKERAAFLMRQREEEEQRRQAAQEQKEQEALLREQRENFTGALQGESGIFKGKTYPLKKDTEAFFLWEEDGAVLSPYENSQSLAGVYFVRKYQEYCVEPFEKVCVYLESGQPLGKGRQYYLPRGTRIYIKTKENVFTLA